MVDLQQGEISEGKEYFAIEQYHGITLHENSLCVSEEPERYPQTKECFLFSLFLSC